MSTDVFCAAIVVKYPERVSGDRDYKFCGKPISGLNFGPGGLLFPVCEEHDAQWSGRPWVPFVENDDGLKSDV